MKTKIIALVENKFLKPLNTNIFFETNLTNLELMIDPATIEAIITVGEFLYETLAKAKDNNTNNIGEWIKKIDYKVDKLLQEIEDIKQELKKIEILIDEIPLKEAETRLNASINRYYLNVFDLKDSLEKPQNLSTFQSIFENIQDDVNTIQNKSFSHLYELILAFIIQFEIASVFNKNEGTKLAIINKYTNYLEKARNIGINGSFAQILQVHNNTLIKLYNDYKDFNGIETGEYFITREKRIFGPGGGGKPGSKEGGNADNFVTYYEIMKIGYNYNITGNSKDGFNIATTYIGEIGKRESGQKPALSENIEVVKNAINQNIQSILLDYQNKNLLYTEISKNVLHLEYIINDINKYIEILNTL